MEAGAGGGREEVGAVPGREGERWLRALLHHLRLADTCAQFDVEHVWRGNALQVRPAALAIAIVYAAVASPARPADDSAFLWSKRPTAGEIERSYLGFAFSLGLAGRAELDCATTPERRLTDCKVTHEQPAGMLFGLSALRLAPLFELAPGRAAQNGRISVRLTFSAPDPTAAVRAMAPRSESLENIALARQLATLRRDRQVHERAQLNRLQQDLLFAALARPTSLEASDNISRAAEAFRWSIPLGAEALVERRAEHYARTYSAAELSELIAFHKTTTAQKLLDGAVQLDPMEAGRRRADAEEIARSAGGVPNTPTDPALLAAPLTEEERQVMLRFQDTPTGRRWFENNRTRDLPYRIAGALAVHDQMEAARERFCLDVRCVGLGP